MGDNETPTRQWAGRIKDARGRLVTQLDPVKMHLLNQDTLIPTETLHAIVDDLLPGARRKRLIQVLSVAFGFLFVVGGHVVYFRYFSTWRGLDPVNTSIYVLQIAVLLSGPFIAFRMARNEYAGRVAAVMLRYFHCPHCGYDIRGLPPEPEDGVTVCPECGCAWHLAGVTEHAGPYVATDFADGSLQCRRFPGLRYESYKKPPWPRFSVRRRGARCRMSKR